VFDLIALGVIWWSVSKLVRFNMLGYFLLFATMTAAESAAELLAQPNSFFRANGTAVLIAALLMLAWPLMAGRRAALAAHAATADGADRGDAA
jgi:hypothetical protein